MPEGKEENVMGKGFIFNKNDPNKYFLSRRYMGPVGIHQINLICKVEGQEIPTTSHVTDSSG